MSHILYEHPLNEKVRSYLKIEQLFGHLHRAMATSFSLSYPVFFNALFTILDHLERNDTRGDLIKDLEKLESNLITWSQSPQVNNEALQQTLQQAVKFICQLKVVHPTWTELKQDKFLSSIKQRFAIQGGQSNFDLPQLQFWLHQDEKVLKAQLNDWLENMILLEKAIAMCLHFLREKNNFKPLTASNGFYQDNGEGVSLIRIKLPDTADIYPTISGNRFRYSIRFAKLCAQEGRKFSLDNIPFQLACC